MRRLLLAGLLLMAAGCTVHGRDPSAPRPNLGILVQASAGRCTTVLVGKTSRRVCAPGRSGGAPADTAAPDTVRATR